MYQLNSIITLGRGVAIEATQLVFCPARQNSVFV